jgi:hypothetical protein
MTILVSSFQLRVSPPNRATIAGRARHSITCLGTERLRKGWQVREWSAIGADYVLHCIRVMKKRPRNITLTLEERVARWARLEAARRDTSVSRLLAGILEERMLEQDVYPNAMRRALARKPFLRTNGRYLSRGEAHDRPGHTNVPL